jgi:ADP-ribose pyrophosphatase YjhB (NUDIX family)
MLHLIPPPLHRAGLRWAHRLRHAYRRIARPRLVGVSLVVADDAERVMLVRHTYGPGQWSFPGGGLARGEDPEAAARRELREELRCEAAELSLIETVEEEVSGSPHTAYVFAVRLASEPRPDRREVMEARFFAESEIPQGLHPITRSRLELWRAWRSKQR